MNARRGTFRYRLFLSYLPIVLLAMGIFAALTFWAVRRDLTGQAERMTSRVAWESGASFDNGVEMCERSMSFLIGNPEISAALHSPKADYYALYEDLSRVLLRQLNLVRLQSNEIESIVFYSENEILTGRSAYLKPLSGIEAEPWYAQARDSYRLFWTVQGDEAVAIYHFIPPGRDAPANYLVCTLSLKKILGDDRWESYDLDHFLADADGRVISPLEGAAAGSGAEARILREPERGSIRVDGVRYLTAAQPLANGWTLYILTQEKNMVGFPTYTLFALTALLLVCCAGLIWMTRTLSVRLSRRVENLGETMRQVRAGDLSVHVAVEGEDEIGQLEQGFRDVMQMLNSLIDDVYRSSELQKESELALLHAQIKPHFLYNTLSLISWEAIRQDAPEISEIANHMADYYRTMLNDGKESILLRDELRNIQAYLAIQLTAHRQSFSVEYDVPEELGALPMISTVLQPLVENAVRHGVDMRPAGGGRIRVSACRREGDLFLFVEDNGPGMSEETLRSILEKETGGYGVRNVHARIRLYAGAGYGLSYESGPGQGTRVTVRLPVRAG